MCNILNLKSKIVACNTMISVRFNEFVSLYSRMLGGVAGRHMSNRRRGSSPMVRATDEGIPPSRYARRRRAVTTSDHKSCALIQTRLKLGDIM